jgi:hypothetical protein
MNAPIPSQVLLSAMPNESLAADTDPDPQETAEWREAFLALAASQVTASQGPSGTDKATIDVEARNKS